MPKKTPKGGIDELRESIELLETGIIVGHAGVPYAVRLVTAAARKELERLESVTGSVADSV